MDAGFRRKERGADLNRGASPMMASLRATQGKRDEHRKHALQPVAGTTSMDDVRPDRGALRRRPQGANPVLPRAFQGDGLRTTHLSGEPSGHRDLLGCATREALPYGVEQPGEAQHAGRRQRTARLADVCRLRAGADRTSPPPVWKRTGCAGCEGNGLCAGFHYDRPLPGLIPLGGVPACEGGGKAAHAHGPARLYPQLHPRERWEDARCERVGSAHSGSRKLLRDGPGVPVLRAIVRVAFGRGVLRHTGQVQHRYAAAVLRTQRSGGGHHVRPDGGVPRCQDRQGLSAQAAAHQAQGPGRWASSGLPHQQLQAACGHHRRTLPQPLEGGVVLQMDQAASAHQEILRSLRECGEVPDLDRRVGVPAGGHRQKAVGNRGFAPFNSTDLLGHALRENAHPAGLSEGSISSRTRQPPEPVDFVRLLTGQQCLEDTV
ncbi:MAG: hypothetical protein BWX95_02272 [Bacteroidetes bacterium ADurb.Bin141]|nr:MAG: hypothetical protein BWX95_02272 [Bacteroidetes bacterium ADurb.Bin141]